MRGAPGDQELGPEKPDALGAVADAPPRSRRAGPRFPSASPRRRPASGPARPAPPRAASRSAGAGSGAPARPPARRRVGSMTTTPLCPSSSSVAPVRISSSAPLRPITAGMPSEWARMAACDVLRALLADEPDDVLAVELHGEPGGELVRHDDDLLARRMDHSSSSLRPMSRCSIRIWMAWRSASRSRSWALPEELKSCAQLERLELVRGLRAQLVVANELLDGGEEIAVLRHEDLRRRRCATPRRPRARARAGPARLGALRPRAPRRAGAGSRPPRRRARRCGAGTSGKSRRTTSAGAQATPGDTPMPRSIRGPGHCSPNPFGHEGGERLGRGLLVVAVGPDHDELPHSAASIMTPMMLLPFTAHRRPWRPM